MNRGSPSQLWQKGCVKVDGAFWRDVQNLRKEDVAICHHHGDIRSEVTDLPEELIPPRLRRGQDREALRLGLLPNRGGPHPPSPAGGSIGLGHDPDNIVPFFAQGSEGRKGKQGRPPEKDPQEATSSACFSVSYTHLTLPTN